MIPKQAIAAAKEAMREVTPPPGISKADWLAEYGDFALIAGAIAAAAPHMTAGVLSEAADALEMQPPKLRAQYVATLRLYAAEPWRLVT